MAIQKTQKFEQIRGTRKMQNVVVQIIGNKKFIQVDYTKYWLIKVDST